MKKKWTYTLLLASALAAAFAVHQLSSEPSKGIFYKVNGGTCELYLLGSIHVGSNEMYPMADSIVEAIEQADVVVFECDTTTPEAQATTAALMKSDRSLEDRVSPECLELVQKAAEKLGYSMDQLSQLDSWAITSMMTVSAAADEMDAGNSKTASKLGVENVVRKRLKKQETDYLETVEQQLGLLEAFSPELQEYLLVSACEAVLGIAPAKNQDLEQWPGWWREGNAQAFADSYIRSLSSEASPELAMEYHHALLVERNHHMASKLIDLLENAQNKKVVAVVGLMHLVTEQDSVIAELQAKGYTVEQIR